MSRPRPLARRRRILPLALGAAALLAGAPATPASASPSPPGSARPATTATLAAAAARGPTGPGHRRVVRAAAARSRSRALRVRAAAARAARVRAARARAARAQRPRLLQGPLAGRRAHGLSGWAAPGLALAPPAGPAGPATAFPAPAAAAPVPALPGAVTGALTPAAEAPAPAAPPPPPATTSSVLGIQTTETPDYRMLLSRTTVAAGPVRLQLKNTGEDPHNALIVRSDGTGTAIAIALTAPGAATSRSVSLPAGSYRLFCTLTAPLVHETAGMRATLTVVP